MPRPSRVRRPCWRRSTPTAMAEVWARAITRPPAARFRVLVALSDSPRRGVRGTGPAGDPDADGQDGAIEELAIDPVGRRPGPRLAAAQRVRRHPASRRLHPRHLLGTDVADDLRRFPGRRRLGARRRPREIGTDDESVRAEAGPAPCLSGESGSLSRSKGDRQSSRRASFDRSRSHPSWNADCRSRSTLGRCPPDPLEFRRCPPDPLGFWTAAAGPLEFWTAAAGSARVPPIGIRST